MKILMILLCKMLTSHGDENPQQTLLKKVELAGIHITSPIF